MMTLPTILNAEPYGFSPRAKSILQSVAHVRELTSDFADFDSSLPHIDALIVRLGYQIDANILNRANRLRFIATATTGLDHIDIHEANARGVQVLSLRGEQQFLRSIPATSEHTWGLLLALSRNLVPAFESVRRDEWNRDAFRGHDLRGQTLGIIGLGRIGQRIAKYANAFDMRVLAYDPNVNEAFSEVTKVERLSDLVAQSDVITIHAPLNEDTIHLVGKREFQCAKPGCLFVNTARGAIVDNREMLNCLRTARIRGAAIDVVEDERVTDRCISRELIEYAKTHDNLLITPHIGGATYESMESTEIFIARKLATALQRSNHVPGQLTAS